MIGVVTKRLIPNVQNCRLLELKGLTMYRITKRPPLLMAILLAAVLIVSLGMSAAVESQSGQSSPKHEVPSAERKQQVFELRVYTAAPGKLESLNKRFREHTLR